MRGTGRGTTVRGTVRGTTNPPRTNKPGRFSGRRDSHCAMLVGAHVSGDGWAGDRLKAAFANRLFDLDLARRHLKARQPTPGLRHSTPQSSTPQPADPRLPPHTTDRGVGPGSATRNSGGQPLGRTQLKPLSATDELRTARASSLSASTASVSSSFCRRTAWECDAKPSTEPSSPIPAATATARSSRFGASRPARFAEQRSAPTRKGRRARRTRRCVGSLRRERRGGV